MIFDLRQPVAELALQLVDIPSVSGHEQALADAVDAGLGALGHLERLRDGDAIVARTNLDRGRRVIVAGHLDTVPVAGNLPGRLRDGVLWGRGSVDMKGGLAAMLATAARVEAPASDVTWVFYDHEEVASAKSGLGRLIAHHPDWLAGDFAILCEPTAGGLEGGCNGTLRLAVRASGRAAHSARPWMGVNAIHELVPALDRLVRFEPATRHVDALDYREALNAVGIEGGTAGNVIPDSAALTVNYRFAPDKSESEARRIVEALFEGYEVEVVDSAPGARPGLRDAAVARLAGIVASHGGGAPTAKQGWTDVARFAALGVPAVNLGPGDPSLAHQDDEACPAEQIDCVAAILAEYLEG
ncbi:MAG: succinyl-diaminopimelate desuccinylase [Bifidobacteriaceae bacterium]|jgi:succinyl-diaminopimelate desuccinylase|nr:succinyl-diaminopimelate desuccinylase [Bifidobacteriaceae bacterium]